MPDKRCTWWHLPVTLTKGVRRCVRQDRVAKERQKCLTQLKIAEWIEKSQTKLNDAINSVRWPKEAFVGVSGHMPVFTDKEDKRGERQ